jgi:hypothetical protein
LKDLEILGEWYRKIEFKSLDELVFSSDAYDRIEEMVKTWHSPFE